MTGKVMGTTFVPQLAKGPFGNNIGLVFNPHFKLND